LYPRLSGPYRPVASSCENKLASLNILRTVIHLAAPLVEISSRGLLVCLPVVTVVPDLPTRAGSGKIESITHLNRARCYTFQNTGDTSWLPSSKWPSLEVGQPRGMLFWHER